MNARTIRRRIGIALALFTAASLAIVAGSSWWIAALAGPILSKYNIHADSIEWDKRGHWQIDGLEMPAYQLRIEAARLPTALHYLSARLRGNPLPQIRASGLHLEVHPGEQEDAARADGPAAIAGWGELFNQIQAARDSIASWGPPIAIDDMMIEPPGGAWQLSISELLWRDQQLQAQWAFIQPGLPFATGASSLQLSWDPDRWQMQVQIPDWQLDASTNWQREGTEGLRVDARMAIAAEPLEMVAQLPQREWMPKSVRLLTPSFQLKSPRLLPAMHLSVFELRELEALWENGRYRLIAQASGVSDESLTESPLPLRFRFELEGDLQRAELQQLEAQGPGLELSLSEPVSMGLQQRELSHGAKFILRGDTRLWPVPGPLPEFLVGNIDARIIVLDEERIEISQLDWQSGDKSLVANVTGIFNTVDLAAELEISATLQPDSFLLVYGPVDLLEPLHLRAQVNGPILNPTASIEIDPVLLQGEATQAIRASANAQVDNERNLTGEVRLDTTTQSLDLQVAMLVQSPLSSVSLSSIHWQEGSETLLRIDGPVDLQLLPEQPASALPPVIVPAFASSDGKVELSGGLNRETGLTLSVIGFESAWLNDWLRQPLPAVSLAVLHLSVLQLAPLVLGEAFFDAAWIGTDGNRIAAAATAVLGADLTALRNLLVSIDERPLLEGELRLPLQFLTDGGMPQPDWTRTSPIAGELRALGLQPLNDFLYPEFGISLGDLELNATLAGTLAEPQMQLTLTTNRLTIEREWAPGRLLPDLQDLQLNATLDPQTLRLLPLRFVLNEQSKVAVSGTLDYQDLLATVADPNPDWSGLLRRSFNGSLLLENWRGEDWAAVLPPLLRPAGRLGGEIHILPDYQVSGQLALSGFSLRPSATLPSIHSIRGLLDFKGHSFSLAEASAMIGESPILIDGNFGWENPLDPTWDLHLRGEKLLLLRTTSFVLRSDLDLSLSRPSPGQPPLLAGELNLSQSTLLYDFDLLSANTRGGPTRRPPYFEVSHPVFENWELDVRIRGDDFLTIRSNYFSALLSADFHMGGSLGDPKLFGSASASSGELRFPGAKMRLSQAEVFISPERPDAEQLQISAISERASYIISMEVSNTVSDPRVRFQSTPNLSNAAILRLLTTGSLTNTSLSGLGLYLGQGLLGPGSNDSALNRLTIDVGRDISRSGRNTVDIELELNDSWHIEGEYDRFDAYNLDFVWKAFER